MCYAQTINFFPSHTPKKKNSSHRQNKKKLFENFLFFLLYFFFRTTDAYRRFINVFFPFSHFRNKKLLSPLFFFVFVVFPPLFHAIIVLCNFYFISFTCKFLSSLPLQVFLLFLFTKLNFFFYFNLREISPV